MALTLAIPEGEGFSSLPMVVGYTTSSRPPPS